MKQFAIILCILTLILASCSGSKPGSGDLPLITTNLKADAWINLMPGSMSTFFVTGSFNITNTSDSTINSLQIIKCLVSQNNDIIYNLIPDLKDTLGSLLSMKPGQSKKGIFTSKGVELKNEFNTDKTVDLRIILFSTNKTKEVLIPRIKITKVY